MNALPTRRFNWHPASFVAASLVWMLAAGLNPVSLAAVDAPTTGWRSDSLRLSDAWNTLSLDVTVKRSRVTAAGALVAQQPGARYHVERSSKSGNWKTVITVQQIDRTPLYSVSGLVGSPSPFPVARLEDDEDGTPVRAYDSLGRALTIPTPSSPVVIDPPLYPTRVTGKAWINSLVYSGGNKSARQTELERKYGKGTKVNTTTLRYRKTDTTQTDELLADTKFDPMETTLTKNTVKVAHREFTYGPAYTDTVVRTKIHSESEITAASTDRAVVETYFGNIKLERQ
jgi:hypothetical protein